MRTWEIFRRKVRDAAGVCTAITFYTLNSSLENAIANCQCKREIQIMFGGYALEPAHPATEIVKESLLDFVGSKTGADCL